MASPGEFALVLSAREPHWKCTQKSCKHPTTLDPMLLSHYAFCHYNYKYDWLRPTLEEIVKAYKKLYGGKAHDSDAESDDSSGGEEEEKGAREEEESGAEDEE